MGRVVLVILSVILAEAGSYAQDTYGTINRAYGNYFSEFPEEKLYLHLARPQIMAGEKLYFRIYHLRTQDNQFFPLSKVGYVELIDGSGEIVIDVKVKMDARGGDGFLPIPATINSGIYKVRAYTQWMRNFDSELFFSSNVTIINPFKRLGLSSVDTSKYRIGIYPEGGSLIEGVRNRLAVQVLDYKGAGVDYHGELTNTTGSHKVHFSSDINGIGNFTFTPEVGDDYTVSIFDSDSLETISEMPKAETGGCTLVVDETESSFLVGVDCANPSEFPLFLSSLSRSNFLFTERISGSTQNRIEFDKSRFLEGVNQLTLFNSDGVPLAERLVFIRPKAKVELKLTTAKEKYESRESIDLEISSLGEVKGDFSVSVYSSNSDLPVDDEDLYSWLWLSSELRGVPLNVDYYLSDEVTARQLNDMLMVHGWRRYDYDRMTDADREVFTPEFREPVLQGSIQDQAGNPMNSAIVYFSGTDSISSTFVTSTDKEGNFIVETPADLNSRELLIRTMDSVSTITLNNQVADIEVKDASQHFDLPRSLESWIVSQSESMQVQNLVMGRATKDSTYIPSSFYGIPTSTYYLDDYTRFPVMEEVLREYVYGVFVRKREGKFALLVLDQKRNVAMEESPLILLDGVPVFDIEELMKLDPTKLKRIEVVKNKYQYGPQLVSGIVAFYSYEQDMADFPIDESTLRANYNSVQRHKEFYQPQISDRNFPDFRNQLLWNPYLSFDREKNKILSFTSSEVKGLHRVVIKGITDKGVAGSAIHEFIVE